MNNPDLKILTDLGEVWVVLPDIACFSDKVNSRETRKLAIERTIEKIEDLECWGDPFFVQNREVCLHLAVILRDLLNRI